MTDEEHTERATLQRRIKNQRKMLRQLNQHVIVQNAFISRLRSENSLMRLY